MSWSYIQENILCISLWFISLQKMYIKTSFEALFIITEPYPLKPAYPFSRSLSISIPLFLSLSLSLSVSLDLMLYDEFRIISSYLSSHGI